MEKMYLIHCQWGDVLKGDFTRCLLQSWNETAGLALEDQRERWTPAVSLPSSLAGVTYAYVKQLSQIRRGLTLSQESKSIFVPLLELPTSPHINNKVFLQDNRTCSAKGMSFLIMFGWNHLQKNAQFII